MQRALEQVHVDETARPLHRRPRRGHARGARRPGRVEPARLARAAQARARPRRARRAATTSTPDDVKAVAVPALAHRLTLRPELWVQRLRAGRHRARAPRAGADAGGRAGRPAVTRAARAEAPRLRRARRPRPARRRSRSAGRSSSRSRRRSRCSPPSGSRSRSRPELRARLELDARAAGRGRGGRRRCRGLRAERSRRAARAAARRCPTGLRRPRRRTRVLSGSRPGERRALELPSRVRALGRVPRRRVCCCARRTASGSSSSRSGLEPPAAAEGLPARRERSSACSGRSRPRRSPATRSRACRGEGIEFADLRPFVARRPRAARELARDRAARRALGERDASGAERRRRPLPRHLRRGAARRPRGRSTSPCGRPARSPTHYLREKDRVGLVSFGGVLNWLTASSGPVQLYRIVDSLLDAEILLSYAWKDIDVIPTRTLPPRALVLALTPAARRAGRGRAARPARPRLRPRGHRDLAGARSSSRGRDRELDGSRTGSGGCAATRCARVRVRWACPSSSGATGCRSRLRSRR